MHSSRSKDDEAANRDGFDCGFLVLGNLNPRIRDEQFGRYWGGFLVSMGPSGFMIILSIHFIHKNRDEGDTIGIDFVDEVCSETLEFHAEMQISMQQSCLRGCAF